MLTNLFITKKNKKSPNETQRNAQNFIILLMSPLK